MTWSDCRRRQQNSTEKTGSRHKSSVTFGGGEIYPDKCTLLFDCVSYIRCESANEISLFVIKMRNAAAVIAPARRETGESRGCEIIRLICSPIVCADVSDRNVAHSLVARKLPPVAAEEVFCDVLRRSNRCSTDSCTARRPID